MLIAKVRRETARGDEFGERFFRAFDSWMRDLCEEDVIPFLL